MKYTARNFNNDTFNDGSSFERCNFHECNFNASCTLDRCNIIDCIGVEENCTLVKSNVYETQEIEVEDTEYV